MGSAGDIARSIKGHDATARILMTGTHPAALPERTMREESIDFVCDLEGPRTICETAEALKSGVDDFGAIASLWWRDGDRSEEHTSELQSLMRISYAVFCLKKKKTQNHHTVHN